MDALFREFARARQDDAERRAHQRRLVQSALPDGTPRRVARRRRWRGGRRR